MIPTPKEKALDLVEKMKNELPITAGSAAVQCALIAVYELIQEYYYMRERARLEYFQEVKQELEKL